MQPEVRLRLASSFGATASAYDQHRPDYASAAVRWALAPAPGPRILDLGAGTGELTSTLVALGADVIAVEPEPAILTELHHALPDVRALADSAETIPLPDASVDAVPAGNAVHWFDMTVAAPEISRVLAPRGVLAGLWNVMDDRGDWVGGLDRVRAAQPSAPVTHSAPGVPRRRACPFRPRSGCRVRLSGAGRVPARAASHRRPPPRGHRHLCGGTGHAGPRARRHARPDPRFPREQARNLQRRIHPSDADGCAARPAAVKASTTRRCGERFAVRRTQHS